MKIIKKYFSFYGVASRKEWWLVNLLQWVLLFVAVHLDNLLFGASDNPGYLLIGVFLISLWPVFATQIRRWHDRSKTGAWALISIIPVIGWIWALIELGFFPSVESSPFRGHT